MADIAHNVIAGTWVAGAEVPKNRKPTNPEGLTGPCARGGVGRAVGLKKVRLEMGGKLRVAVPDDAEHALAVNACLNGAFAFTGQGCTTASLGGREQGQRAMDFYTSVKTAHTRAGE